MLLEARRRSCDRTAWCRPAVSLNGSRRSGAGARGTRPARRSVGKASAVAPAGAVLRRARQPSARRARRAPPRSPVARHLDVRRADTPSSRSEARADRRAASSPSWASAASTCRATVSRSSAAQDAQRGLGGRSPSTSDDQRRRRASLAGGQGRRRSSSTCEARTSNGPTTSPYQAAAGARRCAATATAIGRVARREQRGVVDEPGEQRVGGIGALTRRPTLADALRGRTVGVRSAGRRRPLSDEHGGATMPYYRQVGEVPRKRHTQFRQPDGGLYAEELMGIEGFSTDSALLYHRHLPTAIVASRGVRRRRRSHRRPNHPLKPRHLRTHKLDAAPAPTPITGRPAPAGQRRRAHLLRRSPTGRRRCTATRSATSASTSSPARRVVETVFGALDGRRRRLRRASRRRRRTAGCRTAATAAPAGDRGDRAHRAAAALPVAARPVPRARAVLRARPARPGEPLLGRRRRTSRCSSRHRQGLDPVHLRPPPVRRGRLGRLPLPVRRSRSTTSSRSPAGCTSRRRCTRPSRARTS